MHPVTYVSVVCSSPSLQAFLNESLNALNLLQFRFLSLVLSVTLVHTLASESHFDSNTSVNVGSQIQLMICLEEMIFLL